MRFSQFALFFLLCFVACTPKMAQKQYEIDSSNLTPKEFAYQHQQELNSTYADKEKSILSETQREKFIQGGYHPFFPYADKYRITADFEVYDNPKKIGMKTSTSRIAKYKIYGKASFTLDGTPYSLLLYKSVSTYPGYENSLFIPFTDLTSGEETYGGGRYIDVQIPEDKTKIVIDFNLSYQPYCSYTTGYSCPIPPEENFLDHRIIAGIKHVDLH